MDAPLDLPRSVLLALWLAPDAAGARPDRAAMLRAVQGDDEPHEVIEGDGSAVPLGDVIDDWTGGPIDVAALVLAPGDAGAAPAQVSPAAIDAGECLLVRTPTACVAAVPQVEQFGSALEPGHLVTWHVTEVPDWRIATHGRNGSLQDADRDLRQGLITVTEALVRLDVAQWRPDDAELVVALRGAALPHWRMPDHLDGRRARVLASAARLRAIVALATKDDGGAVSLWQADQRSAALRDVDRMSRRAIAAAATFPAL
ncbi:hypothetical protein [Cellulomonas edaphi]|uniref:Uncharacterized protein n=1 Tax=Cellulomonas edaphi TaxID=3053468 RepID=A0ABT7S7F3_9CELL|nr:hypothetical protein [Cellulomons edaphi]MDM7830962.1 hypothetical protein [Cellulomons edaphi]